MLLMNLFGFTVVFFQLCWCLACSSASLRLGSYPFPKFCTPTQKNFVIPGKNASQTSLGCLCSKTFCKILDKAAEDLSNLRKSTKASGSDAIELSDEYIECLLSSFSESQKLNTKYLIEHGYSSMKLPITIQSILTVYYSCNHSCLPTMLLRQAILNQTYL